MIWGVKTIDGIIWKRARYLDGIRGRSEDLREREGRMVGDYLGEGVEGWNGKGKD